MPRRPQNRSVRAVIYARVSFDPRDTQRSVEEQETECRAVAAHEGWDVVEAFIDNDRSASRFSTKERPQYKRLVSFIDSGGCDVLIAWESSRLTRDLAAFVPLRDLSRERNVLWNYGGRVLDLANADDAFSATIDAAVNEKASAETSKRVQRNVRARAAQGRPHGRITYGYAREYDPLTGASLRQVENGDTAPIVRELFRRVSAGETLHAITNDLNARGVPGPRGPFWHRNAVSKIVQNPAYIAQRVHQGEVVGPGQWPALVDDSVFYPLQAVMTDPARRTNRDGAVQWLLSGIAVCGVPECDAPMVRHGDKVNGVRYACSAKYHNGRRVEIVDPYVRDVVVAYLSRPEVAKTLVEESGSDTGPLLAALNEKRARLDLFATQAADGDISPSAFSTIERRLIAGIEADETALRQSSASPVLAEVLAAGRIEDRWDDLPMTTRREVVRLLFTVRILPTGRSDRRLDTSTIVVEPKF